MIDPNNSYLVCIDQVDDYTDEWNIGEIGGICKKYLGDLKILRYNIAMRTIKESDMVRYVIKTKYFWDEGTLWSGQERKNSRKKEKTITV